MISITFFLQLTGFRFHSSLLLIYLFKADDKKVTCSKFITIVIKLINANLKHSSVKTKKKTKKRGVLNKPYIRQIVCTYPTRTVVGDPLLNVSFESK